MMYSNIKSTLAIFKEQGIELTDFLIGPTTTAGQISVSGITFSFFCHQSHYPEKVEEIELSLLVHLIIDFDLRSTIHGRLGFLAKKILVSYITTDEKPEDPAIYFLWIILEDDGQEMAYLTLALDPKDSRINWEIMELLLFPMWEYKK